MQRRYIPTASAAGVGRSKLAPALLFVLCLSPRGIRGVLRAYPGVVVYLAHPSSGQAMQATMKPCTLPDTGKRPAEIPLLKFPCMRLQDNMCCSIRVELCVFPCRVIGEWKDGEHDSEHKVIHESMNVDMGS